VNPVASRNVAAPEAAPTPAPSMLEKPARPHRDFAPKASPDKADDSTQP
jgi:hypothetical protein